MRMHVLVHVRVLRACARARMPMRVLEHVRVRLTSVRIRLEASRLQSKSCQPDEDPIQDIFAHRALSAMVDRFCCSMTDTPDIFQAMQEWNLMQAVMLKASGSIEWSFITLLLATSAIPRRCRTPRHPLLPPHLPRVRPIQLDAGLVLV